MNYTELFENLDNMIDNGDIIITEDGELYTSFDNVENLQEFLGFGKYAAMKRATKIRLKAETKKGDKKNDYLNKKANALQKGEDAISATKNGIEAGSGVSMRRAKKYNEYVKNKTQKVNAAINDKQQKFIKKEKAKNDAVNALSTASSNMTNTANNVATNNAAIKKAKEDQKQNRDAKNIKNQNGGKTYGDSAVNQNAGTLNNQINTEPKQESFVLNMPETLYISEDNNYEYFLEQVLAYNGFKVTENNVNVLHAALENGHAVIE